MTAPVLQSALLSMGLLILVAAAVQDLRTRRIPNGLVISVAVTGLLLGAFSHPHLLWINIVAALLVLVVFGALSHLETLGGGDIKLMTAVTLLVPPSQIAGLLVAIALAGGIVSVIYLVLGRGMKDRARHRSPPGQHNAFARWWRAEQVRIRSSRTVPYALAISGGSISFIIAGWYRCLSATSCSL